jgi:hypothetical protein
MCDAGVCQCFNGTGLDLDKDDVMCPEDCDDLDPYVSKDILCFRDRDNDHYPHCDPYSYIRDDGEDDGEIEQGSDGGGHHRRRRKRSNCMRFCVAENDTCPYGWADPSDSDRFEKYRSKVTEGSPCSGENVTDTDECDCCDRDPRAFPGSMYAANEPNWCGNADYDCDGETTTLACCTDGQEDTYRRRHHHQDSADSNSPDPRTLWYKIECVEVDDECGGCSTENETAIHRAGWACEESCSDVDPSLGSVVARRRKRQLSDGNDCPPSCDGECVCVDSQETPMLGECAKVVTSCIEVRPGIFGDAEECCVATVH